MKPLVIYHANCADGFGAAFAAWTVLGDEAEYVAYAYNTPFSEQLVSMGERRDVYILDFSFPREVMDHMFANANRVVWLDHHKTAFEMWEQVCEGPRYKETSKNTYIILDDNKSGAILAWEYFHPGEEVPYFITLIDEYDRWVFHYPDTKPFNKALWSITPWSFAQWKCYWDGVWGFQTSDGLEGMPTFLAQGEAILRAHDQNVRSVVKGGARKVHIHDIPYEHHSTPVGLESDEVWNVSGLVANCPPHLTSDVGHELALKSGTFGLCWTLGQAGSVAKCSLRSNGDYDVSAIARAFDGGGHRNAAGFEVDIQVLLGWLK